MSFNKVLEHYRKISFSERDKGDRFERLMQAYLLTDPKYTAKFKSVWLWNEFHGKGDMGGTDTGIDLVARTHEGDYWAIQCKCYREGATIDKPAIDSFIATSSRAFKNEELKTVHFSQRLWIDTTGKRWGSNAEEAIRNQNPPFIRLNLYELREAPVDWEKLDKGIHGEASRTEKKRLRPHQKEALEKTHEHFKNAARGKLIMACGTGKTFTALRIAENETAGKGTILFLVPSIALLGQTLREWYSDANEELNAVCICSDPKVTRKSTKNEDSDGFSIVDLALPASTDPKEILKQFQGFKAKSKPGMTVVFSTYQSIEVIANAQKELLDSGFPEFDLIICDEAHRTTGAKLPDMDESAFVKVHDQEFLKAKKRLYMTATPRMYSDDVKSKAAQGDVPLWSMDRVDQFGEEMYRIGFGAAVDQGLLTDYKVLILTLSDKNVPPAVQKMIADKESEITTDDASKLIGCINALSKKFLGEQGILVENDRDPMKRAVAFCQNIAVSKKITATYNTATEAYLKELPAAAREQMVSVAAKHVDGSMAAPEREELLAWLKEEPENNQCRILSNVRCLSEGVDVPSLDAVLFLSARNSQIDVVQSVGRVMRISPGKKYGYIIIPVVVPSDVDADKALDDNDRYRVVWTVLNALRAHDDRFNATVNKIELNRKRPTQILVGMPQVSWEDGMPIMADPDQVRYDDKKDFSRQMAMQFEQLQHVVYAKMVQKVGDRRYWEQWAKSVAEIADRQGERIHRLISEDKKHNKAFANFLGGLQKNINPSISQQEAVEMLSQHIITKPVFEALFEGYSFVKNNPISVSMQSMLDILEEQSIEKDTETLRKFYESVKIRAAGIDNAEGKQRIIIELYDKFFKAAFPKMVEKLGIVYTPIEVVDYIIHSVNDILKIEFDRNISEDNIHILDPFTGTGTFVTRLLQSGLIHKKDLKRKYEKEIHANEIVLLAYYIAAVNIENAYHDSLDTPVYKSFDGICLTDTFQLGESEKDEKLFEEMFPQNTERVERQKKAPLRVIMGNPPYSAGQKSANDNAQNEKYVKLDKRIASTYANATAAANKNSLYDSYIRSFRWSSDRLDKSGGIIAFVTNGGWLEGNSADGFRKVIKDEFSAIYVLNLRGNGRTSGERCRQEGEPLFAAHGGKGGSLTPITITFLVKNPEKAHSAEVFYHDIGMYLKRKEKLERLKSFVSLSNTSWTKISPNEHGDWIGQRNNLFETFIPLASEKKFDLSSKSFFVVNSRGLETTRDAWVYSSSKENLLETIGTTVAFYNSEVNRFQKAKQENSKLNAADFVNTDPTKISWSSSLIPQLEKGSHAILEKENVRHAEYRPFFKQHVYLGEKLIHRRGQFDEFVPEHIKSNKILCVPGIGVNKEFTCKVTDIIPDLEIGGKTQCFPLHYYEKRKLENPGIFDQPEDSEYIQRDGISDYVFDLAKNQYGRTVTKEDIFYYVYGYLHSPGYRESFTNDLKKMLPRLPLVEDVRDFWSFSKGGRELAELHINYEALPPFDRVTITGFETGFYTVEKMRFPKKDQKDTILFNSKITVSNIPGKAYEYVINGKSAIEWIMERYQPTIHKESGIRNDPNDWAKEVGNPRYILDLLLSVINVSVKTVEIVEGLPKLKFTSEEAIA